MIISSAKPVTKWNNYNALKDEGWSWTFDLNYGAGGKYIYLFYKR